MKTTTKTVSDILKHEHQMVLMVLQAAERQAAGIDQTGKADTETINEILDFFRTFTDKCHHSKEEKLLFPKMQERGLPVGHGPIAVMLMEHDEGRRLLRAVSDNLDAAGRGEPQTAQVVRDSLLAYGELMRAHIDKEDNVLYPLAERILTPEDQRELIEAFDKVEAEEMGEGVHEKYHQLAHDLSGK